MVEFLRRDKFHRAKTDLRIGIVSSGVAGKHAEGQRNEEERDVKFSDERDEDED